MASSRFLISSTTLTGSQATVTFSSIPSTYTDLCLKVSSRDNQVTNNDYIYVTFNSSATGYSETQLYGFSTSVVSSRLSSQTKFSNVLQTNGSSQTANTFASAEMYIPNYALTTNKPVSGWSADETNDTTNAFNTLVAGYWSGAAAITSMTLTSVGNFVSGSSFYLYGIKNS